MKKIILFILLFLCSATPLFAKDFTFVDTEKNNITVKAAGSSATISITNTTKTYIQHFSIWGSKKSDGKTLTDRVFERLDYGNNRPITNTATIHTVPGLIPDHTYYLSIVGSKNSDIRDVFEFKTDTMDGLDVSAQYPLNAMYNASTKSITVTMTGAPSGQTKYQLYKNNLDIVGDIKQATNGIVKWELTGTQVAQNTEYAFHVKIPADPATGGIGLARDVTGTTRYTVGTPSPTTTSAMTVVITGTSSTSVTVSGKAPSQAGDVSLKFEWSDTEGFTNAHNLVAGPGGVTTIAADGTYSTPITNLNPSKTYYFKASLLLSGSANPIDTKTGTFTTEKGYLIPGSVGETLDFNSRSYHLLAPWPGLSVLMDPDLCAQKKADGSVPQNAICDVNGFLDFAFKLMIGLAAVVLVLRLMYEGYVILTTDVPFLQASAKGNFKTALLGLLLALSSYVILNTINPKLVNNTISIDSANVGVEDVYDRADDPNFIARLDSVNIDGITANINDETFLIYLAHQQGAGGANAILAAAKSNTAVPANINRNMSTNFNTKDAQKTIKTSVLTPINFLNYWAIKVAAFKKNPAANIPAIITNDLSRVSQETGVSLVTLQVICRIESSCNGQGAIENVNSYGYAGLFQLSNSIYMQSKKPGVWEKFKKADGEIKNAYHNAYAAGFMKSNISLLKR